MSNSLRARLIVIGAIVLGVLLAWQLAHGHASLPAAAIGVAAGGLLVRYSGLPLSAILLGIALFGYFVGNRGFAQVMAIPGLPLLPAELVLLAGGFRLIMHGALTQRLPVRRDALNLVIGIWILVGTARLLFDIRDYRFMALRDYAMVYYAVFFFLGQHLVEEARTRAFLLCALLAAAAVQPFAAILFEAHPEWFLDALVFNGVPLIYFKGDLALVCIGISALLIALATKPGHARWLWPVATGWLLFTVSGANRASMLGACGALAVLAVSRAQRARRFVVLQGGAILAALMLVMAIAAFTDNTWAERRLEGIAERARSLTDLTGQERYVSEESYMKGDNNLFRWLWWRSVVDETVALNPMFGLGFGYDLSRGFLQVYNPAMLPDDFAARSPHSILVTTFGRMGIVGVLVFLGVMAVTGVTTVRTIRAVDVTSTEIALWASAWLILISACFGVVLEGPMGAVVFWTLLGMANGGWREPVREMEERARMPNPGCLRTSDPTASNPALSGVSELERTSS